MNPINPISLPPKAKILVVRKDNIGDLVCTTPLIHALRERYPKARPSPHEHLPEYPAYITFNDGVTAGNIDLLVMCYQVLGDVRLLDPIRRGMRAFVVTQQRAPQAGWALQYTRDLEPAGARTYEPLALSTHTTAANAAMLLKFYRLTGDTAFLARAPEALDWLDAVRVSPQDAAIANGGTLFKPHIVSQVRRGEQLQG